MVSYEEVDRNHIRLRNERARNLSLYGVQLEEENERLRKELKKRNKLSIQFSRYPLSRHCKDHTKYFEG